MRHCATLIRRREAGGADMVNGNCGMPARRSQPISMLLHGIALGMLTGLLCGAGQTLAATDPATEPLPPDAELEAAGARIGDIEIEREPIFDLNDPNENNWLFRLADRLHVNTHESAIRAQLLFRSGDRYSRRLLDETARNLRQNSPFMREPEIFPVRYHDGRVDIVVLTHDVWTLDPQLDFGRSGGTNTITVDFTDDNFLGTG